MSRVLSIVLKRGIHKRTLLQPLSDLQWRLVWNSFAFFVLFFFVSMHLDHVYITHSSRAQLYFHIRYLNYNEITSIPSNAFLSLTALTQLYSNTIFRTTFQHFFLLFD
jgi:hypothetical protein